MRCSFFESRLNSNMADTWKLHKIDVPNENKPSFLRHFDTHCISKTTHTPIQSSPHPSLSWAFHLPLFLHPDLITANWVRMETDRLCQRFHNFTLTHSQRRKEGGKWRKKRTRTWATKLGKWCLNARYPIWRRTTLCPSLQFQSPALWGVNRAEKKLPQNFSECWRTTFTSPWWIKHSQTLAAVLGWGKNITVYNVGSACSSTLCLPVSLWVCVSWGSHTTDKKQQTTCENNLCFSLLHWTAQETHTQKGPVGLPEIGKMGNLMAAQLAEKETPWHLIALSNSTSRSSMNVCPLHKLLNHLQYQGCLIKGLFLFYIFQREWKQNTDLKYFYSSFRK